MSIDAEVKRARSEGFTDGFTDGLHAYKLLRGYGWIMGLMAVYAIVKW